MSNYGSSKYVKIRTKEQTAKQYIADKVISDQIFEKNLKRLAELHTPAKEKKEKDTMLDRGIKYSELKVLYDYHDVLEAKKASVDEQLREDRNINMLNAA